MDRGLNIIRTRNFIFSNKTAYKVLSVEAVNYSTVRRGTIDRHLNNNNSTDGWLIFHTDYYVTVNDKNEHFNRIFVLTESEAKEQLFLKTDE